MDLVEWLRFFVGLAALIGGANLLVRGASRLAAELRISPLVIGLTVVAFGTSAPELAVSIRASLAGQTEMAMGNVVGSNIFNTLFILGLTALVSPLRVHSKLVRFDVPLMVGLSAAVWYFASDGLISRPEGGTLFAGVLLYSGFMLYQSRRQSRPSSADSALVATPKLALFAALASTTAGLILLVLGSNWLVAGAIELASLLGVGERVIGLTLVAAGTSMPELATSLAAALRGDRDIAIGNVVGSNVFNLLAVLGLASSLSTEGVVVSTGSLAFDIPLMVVVAIACLPVFFTGFEIDRFEGGLFLMVWIVSTVLLYLGATSTPWPLATILLAVVILNTFRQGLRQRNPD